MADPKPKARASKTEGTEQVYVRLKSSTAAALVHEAESRMIDKSLIVERALAQFLPHLRSVDELLAPNDGPTETLP